jgi:hypothetical protein
MNDKTGIGDTVTARIRTARRPSETAGIFGHGIARLVGPDGTVKQQVAFTNLITDVGDEAFARAIADDSPALPTGMRLGTGSTAPSKSGAGAAIVTYVSGSAEVFDDTFPSTSNKGAGDGHRATFQVTWDAGDATSDDIEEVVLTNESTPLTDGGGSAANTVARALLDPVVNKGADDSLEVVYHLDALGA